MRDALFRRVEGAAIVAIQLDHIILAVNDRKKSIEFYVGILGLKYEGDREPFSILRVTPDFTLQLAGWGTKGGEHLAFAMSRKEFDEVFHRVVEAKIEYGDDFHSVGNMRGPGDETSASAKSAGGGARGPGKNLYFFDPSRHLIEIRHYEG
jgi:catechol 2,3-dioxygenase-like lactoylglutathione lyase family enzyme